MECLTIDALTKVIFQIYGESNDLTPALVKQAAYFFLSEYAISDLTGIFEEYEAVSRYCRSLPTRHSDT